MASKSVYTQASGLTTVTKFAADVSGQTWADLTSGGSLTTRYVLGEQLDQKYARVDVGGVSWLLSDRLGSVRDVTNSSGAVVAHVDRDGYGNVTVSSGSGFGEIGFVGQRQFAEVFLLKSDGSERWYFPVFGSWMQEDPIRWGAGRANLRPYADNNPTNLVDPRGTWPEWMIRFERWMDKQVGDPLGTAYNNSDVFHGFVEKTDQAARGVKAIPVVVWDAGRLVAWDSVNRQASLFGVSVPQPEMHSDYAREAAKAKAEGRGYAFWGEATLDTVGLGMYSNAQEGTRAARQYIETDDASALRRYYGGSTAQALFFIGGNRLLASPQRPTPPPASGQFQISGPGAIGKITVTNTPGAGGPQMPALPLPEAPPLIAGPPPLGSLPIGNMPAVGAPQMPRIPVVGGVPGVGAPQMPRVPAAAGPTTIIESVMVANISEPAIPNLPIPKAPICPKATGPIGVRMKIRLEEIPANAKPQFQVVLDKNGKPMIVRGGPEQPQGPGGRPFEPEPIVPPKPGEPGFMGPPPENAPKIAPLKPEQGYLGSKKHGIHWKEGKALATRADKVTGEKTPQGQWGSKADLDWAGEQAAKLAPGKSDFFDLPEGHSSIVWGTDGIPRPANRAFLRNNGTGTFHGYPLD